MKPICIVQNWAPESPGFLVDYIKEEALPYNVVHNYDGETLPDPANIEAAIILGTPTSVRDYREHEYLRRLFGFMSELVRQDTPTLGICFGGQLLARVLGAEVTRNEVREIGIYTASLTDEGAADPLSTVNSRSSTGTATPLPSRSAAHFSPPAPPAGIRRSGITGRSEFSFISSRAPMKFPPGATTTLPS